MGKIRKDLTGRTFGRLTVLEAAGHVLRGQRKERVGRWLCRCSCGNECLVVRAQLISNKTHSCGCLANEWRSKINKGKFKDFAGQKFFSLTAVRQGPSVWLKHGSRMESVTQWWCRCDCGNERLCIMTRVRHGSIKDCGQHKGWSKHPLYATWYGIKTRCSNENQINYENYGGRGITMFPAWWGDFQVFRTDIEREIGPKPANRTLDRIDNDGNYEPGNIRWATHQEQVDNQRPRKIITKFSDQEIRQEAARRGII